MTPTSISDPVIVTAAYATLGIGWLTTYGTQDTFVAIRDGNGKYLGAIQESVDPVTSYRHISYTLCG